MGFPEKPKELDLYPLEERLISLRIPFMQIRQLPRGGQFSIKGNVVNVPVDVQPTIDALPRTLDQSGTNTSLATQRWWGTINTQHQDRDIKLMVDGLLLEQIHILYHTLDFLHLLFHPEECPCFLHVDLYL
jgi:hypothetical protein